MARDKYDDINEDDLWIQYKQSKEVAIRDYFINTAR